MGFDVSDVSDQGDFYVVEGDIAIGKTDLTPNSISTRHTYYGKNSIISIESKGEKRNIKVYPIGSITTIAKYGDTNCTEKSWADAFKAAIAEWNAINGFGINLVWNDNEGELLVFGNTTTNNLAYAYSPLNGNPRQIHLNPTYRGDYTTLPYERQVQAAVHLLGHALGFPIQFQVILRGRI